MSDRMIRKSPIEPARNLDLNKDKDAESTSLQPETKLNVDELIKNLMASMSRDKDGKLVVKDFLTNPAIINQIISKAIPVLQKDKPMLELKWPVHIVGDLHGQFTDLLRIFELCGHPKITSYLFLGDYVDRGPNSLETICLLLLLRIRYPSKVFLLRGNHECSAINRTHGFSDECEERFQQIPIISKAWGVKAAEFKGKQIWLKFQDVFNWLPFTALVNRRILCMHGGISAKLQSLNQLLLIQRPIDPCIEVDLPTDLLWSDPDPSMPTGANDPEWGPSNRGVSSHFNSKAVLQACRRLNLDMIVHAHQVVQDGYEFFANRKLVTIFSAPNYCGEYNNSGAVMHLDINLMVSFKILKPMEVSVDDIDTLIDESIPELPDPAVPSSDEASTSPCNNSQNSSQNSTPTCSPKKS